MLAPNAWDEEKSVLKRFVKKENLRQRVLLNAGEVFTALGGKRVPTVLFIDRKGIVVDVELGFDKGADRLNRAVAELVSTE